MNIITFLLLSDSFEKDENFPIWWFLIIIVIVILIFAIIDFWSNKS